MDILGKYAAAILRIEFCSEIDARYHSQKITIRKYIFGL
jgi:hypothetical protein